MAEKKKKIFLSSILILILLLFIGVVFLGKIKYVKVTGCEYYSQEEIQKEIMNNGITQNSFGLYYTYALNKGKSLPFVDEISVELKGINRVLIHVQEKSAVGCIKYMGEYIYFDKEGTVVESTIKKQAKIPIIEGINFQKMNLNEKLEIAKEEEDIFERISGIYQLLTKYDIETDKIAFDRRKKVTLYTGNIRVNLGKRSDYEEQMAELSKLLPKAKKKKLKGILDMEHFKEGQDQIIFKVDKS